MVYSLINLERYRCSWTIYQTRPINHVLTLCDANSSALFKVREYSRNNLDSMLSPSHKHRSICGGCGKRGSFIFPFEQPVVDRSALQRIAPQCLQPIVGIPLLNLREPQKCSGTIWRHCNIRCVWRATGWLSSS